MAKAVVDPEELRRFALELKRFNEDLRDRVQSLQARSAALGDTWRDQEHDRFREAFEETFRMLGRFHAVSEEHVPFLLRKAERIDDYLQQR